MEARVLAARELKLEPPARMNMNERCEKVDILSNWTEKIPVRVIT